MVQYERYQPPVRFVEKVLVSHELDARTLVRFPYPPTLSMLAEAGAQTSIFAKLVAHKDAAGIPVDAAGMLLSIKASWRFHVEKEYFEVACRYISNLENFFVMAFEVYDGDVLVADGQFSAILEKKDGGY